MRVGAQTGGMARRENRFVKYWLAPLVLVAAIAAIAIATVSVQNSWWVDRDRPPSADQRAEDGSTIFTGAGRDYAIASGFVVIRVGDGALEADALGLDADGETTMDADVPLQVRVLAPDGVLVLEQVDTVHITTEDGAISRLELAPWGAVSYREFIATLESRAENVGWTPDDFDALADDLTAAQRARTGDTYSATLSSGTAIGAAVSARVTVDTAAQHVAFVITVEP